MQEILDMGGYGAYVWPTYLVAAVIMAGLLIVSVKTLRANESMLERLRAARKDARSDATGEIGHDS